MKNQTLIGLIWDLCLENSANLFYFFEASYTKEGETLKVDIYRKRRLWVKFFSFLFGWIGPWPENNFGVPKMAITTSDEKKLFYEFYTEKKFFGKIEDFNREIIIDNGERIGNFNEDVEPKIFDPVLHSQKAFSEFTKSLKQKGFELFKKATYLDDID